MPIGQVTRGTTGTNRLRRMDRWIAALPCLRDPDPLVVDLGYGASPATVLELHQRLKVPVVGLEIDPDRVAAAVGSQLPGVSFAHGGFEVAGLRPTVIRAANVLRQYDEAEVLPAWRLMVAQLRPGGVLVDGTCDEVGRVSSWIAVGADGPRTFTMSLRLGSIQAPSVVAERLPKVLIHRNVPGERIHSMLLELDHQWAVHAPLGVYSPSQRWVAVVGSMKRAGWPVSDSKSRWRLGELTVSWQAVEPAGFVW